MKNILKCAVFFIMGCSNMENKDTTKKQENEIMADTLIIHAIDLGNYKYANDNEPYILKHKSIQVSISSKLVVKVKNKDIPLLKSKIYYEALLRNYYEDTLQQQTKNTDEVNIKKEIDNAFKNESFEELLIGINSIKYLLKENILFLDVSVDILNMPHKAIFGINLKEETLKWCYVEDKFLEEEQKIYIKKDLIYLGVDYGYKKAILVDINSGQRVFK